MSIFIELKQKLSQQLTQQSTESGLIELYAEVALNNEQVSGDTADLLAWLKGQAVFPHYFWQSRDANITWATSGVVRQFDTLAEAQDFSQRHGFRLFGGVKFEGQCQFILPRVALAKKGDKLTAYLYLDTSEKGEQWLATFERIGKFNSVQNTLTHCEKVSDVKRWTQNVEGAIAQIKNHDFRKVVLANATTLTFEQPISPYDLLNASRAKNVGCYHFLWSEQAGSAFIGSSPERLYKRTGNGLHTEALAGTVAVTPDVAQTERYRLWLLSDQKNRAENQLVVDDIQQQLNGYIREMAVQNIEIKRLHNVQHLRRKIRAVLAFSTTDSDCLAHIHPTAAVAGLPRENALAFIREHEGFIRGWYASALGSFTSDNAEFCVALRSAQIIDHQITLYAGAGIVENSQAESEWDEIERKAATLGELLQACSP